jgi:hypothetical protein
LLDRGVGVPPRTIISCARALAAEKAKRHMATKQ